MQPNEINEVLDRPLSQELLARDLTRLGYVAKDGTPRTRAKNVSAAERRHRHRPTRRIDRDPPGTATATWAPIAWRVTASGHFSFAR